MDNWLQQILTQNKLESLGSFQLSEQEKMDIIKRLQKLKKEHLYQSKIHGLYHSEKVMLFSYILSKLEKLDEADLQILIDASFYHDSRRTSDNHDSFHGLASANYVDILVDDPIYKDKQNLQLLKAIIDGHSRSDENIDDNFMFYDLDENSYLRYLKLVQILKDSDALDRFRFSDYSIAALNENYLRLENSKRLISLAKEINHMYYHMIKKSRKPIQVDHLPKNICCFHSVGFDMFKIETILQNGILSKNELRKKHLQEAINFDGGNMDDWISVVDATYRLNNNSKHMAYNEFTNNGIGFFCFVPKLFNPVLNIEEAYMTGLPYDKGKYPDEKYVYKSIPVEDIKFLIVPEKCKNADIRQLDYIYNTLSEDILIARINYYLRKTNQISVSQINEVLPTEVENYKEVLKNYKSLKKSHLQKKLFDLLEPIRRKINKELQNIVYLYFCEILNKNIGEKISLSEAVQVKLRESKFPFQFLNDENELLILISDRKDKSLNQIEEKSYGK